VRTPRGLAGDVAAIRINPERTIRNKNLEYAAVGKKARPAFLKKEAENFCSRAYTAHFDVDHVHQRKKVFWFFFSKKNAFLS
jgi:hypothetical protein